MKIVETIATGLRSLGVTVLNGVFMSPDSKKLEGATLKEVREGGNTLIAGDSDRERTIELSLNQAELFANKGTAEEFKMLINTHDDGEGFSLEPWHKDATSFDIRMLWRKGLGWLINEKPIATIVPFYKSIADVDPALLTEVNIFGATDGVTVKDFNAKGHLVTDSNGYGVLLITLFYTIGDFGAVTLPNDTSITSRLNLLEILKDTLDLEEFTEYSWQSGTLEFEGDLPIPNVYVSVYDTGNINFWNRDFGDIANGATRSDLDVTYFKCRANLQIRVRRKV